MVRDDNTLKRFDLRSGDVVRTYRGHVSHIFAVKVRGNDMFSGAYDYTARQWNIDDGTMVRTFNEHASYVMGIAIHDGLFYTGSTDSFLKKWEVNLSPYNGTSIPGNPSATPDTPNGTPKPAGQNSAMGYSLGATIFSGLICMVL
jgi:WD40 repeat protein